MKEKMKKITDILRLVYGYGIMITLFAGGLTFFGYIIALFIGGGTAAAICEFIYKGVFPLIIKITTITVLSGLPVMYLSGELALTAKKENK